MTDNRDNRDRDNRDSGFINISYKRDEKCFAVGGTYTDTKGQKWDLGYVKTGPQGLQDAIALVAKQLNPTFAGKGIEKQDLPRRDGRSKPRGVDDDIPF